MRLFKSFDIVCSRRKHLGGNDMLSCQNIEKNYGAKQVLKNINFQVEDGEFIGIMGPSGSGKTTLLNLISTIDQPTSGEILINNQDPHQLNPEQLARFRRQELGMVFQDFNLMYTLTVEENIVLPMTLDNAPLKKMEASVKALAQELNISEILPKRVYEISGGQAQRAAIARAMIQQPALLLADEPTGNLDTKASRDVMHLLRNLNQVHGITVLMVTHDPKDASYCDRVIFIQDGELNRTLTKQDSQQQFYHQVIETLADMEGTDNEF
jgi:ABC-type antimicrobial peptide transport system, ATPase component